MIFWILDNGDSHCIHKWFLNLNSPDKNLFLGDTDSFGLHTYFDCDFWKYVFEEEKIC